MKLTWKEESWTIAPFWALEADNTEKFFFPIGVLEFQKGLLKLLKWQQEEEEMDLGKTDDLREEEDE